MTPCSRRLVSLLAALGLTLPAAAQEYLGQKDFLTQHEINEIRLAQEPNERIQAYLHFASLRIELVRQLLAKEEAGRGAKVHDNLDEFGRILEAIDVVIDDALLRDVDVEETLPILIENEQEFLAALKTIKEEDREDLWRYEFVLEDAIEIASDSLELAGANIDDRKRDILEHDQAEKAAREKTMSDARRKEVKSDKREQQGEQETFESKRPSLLKPGEKVDKPR